jgi:16S rRNA C1402 (ribose-2'-O) methylase RsmI
MLDGAHLALVSDAGTPGISDRILLAGMYTSWVEVDCLPGPTASYPPGYVGFSCDRFVLKVYFPKKRTPDTDLALAKKSGQSPVRISSPLAKVLTELATPLDQNVLLRCPGISNIHQKFYALIWENLSRTSPSKSLW